MDRKLQEIFVARKTPFTERFRSRLPGFLTLLEREWRHLRSLMSPGERELMRAAHHALGTLNELQDGAHDGH